NKVFSHIHQLKADIMFLQETHLKATDHQRLHRNWIVQQFHSKFHSKARGVAILIRNTVQFSPSSILEDPYGRYVIVSGLLRIWIVQQCHSKSHSKARGVAILIRNTVQFSPSSILEDPYGRYVIVSGLL